MNKSVIFLTAILIATIAGTYAVYELYVKQRMRELGEHSAQAKQLQDRIATMQETFSGFKPDGVVALWRKSTQPWSDAVDNRSKFFTLGNFLPEIEIPQEATPKIYYKQEMLKRIKSLEDYAAEKQVAVADVNCGVPPPDNYGEGTNPKADEIAEHFRNYDYCSAVTRLLIDAKPVVLSPLKFWPEEVQQGRSGAIVKRTTGVNMQISMQNLVQFMDKLAQSDRYFSVDEFKVSNADLHQPDPPLVVDLIMTQAYFRPSSKRAAAKVADQTQPSAANERLNSLFGAGGKPASPDKKKSNANESEEVTTWTKIRNFFGFR